MVNLLIQYIWLHKEIALQNSLGYNFVLLSPAMFSEFEGEKSFSVDAISKKIFRHAKIWVGGVAPVPCHDTTVTGFGELAVRCDSAWIRWSHRTWIVEKVLFYVQKLACYLLPSGWPHECCCITIHKLLFFALYGINWKNLQYSCGWLLVPTSEVILVRLSFRNSDEQSIRCDFDTKHSEAVM